MPLRVTVQYVSPGAMGGALLSRPFNSNVSDTLPLEVIVPDTETTGVTVPTLKKLLILAQEGKLDSASAGTFGGDSVSAAITASYADNA